MADRDSITVESWRPVVGFEGFYSVSDLGRVRRDAKGHGLCVAGHIMRLRLRSGYPVVCLSIPGKRLLRSVHSLVAAAFIGSRPGGYMVNHKGGIKTENRLINLEYVTPHENCLHAQRMGLLACGDRNGSRLHPERLAWGNANPSRMYPEKLKRGAESPATMHPERMARGSAHGRAVLTESKVAEILVRVANGEHPARFASEYGVHKNTIYLITNGVNWKHVSRKP